MELLCVSSLVMVLVLTLYLCWGYTSSNAVTHERAERVRLLRVRPYDPGAPDTQPASVVRRRPADGEGEQPPDPAPGSLGTRQPKPVQRQLLPLYQEKGWHKDGHTYRGFYRACGRKYAGEIHERYRGLYQVYIHNPPVQQLKHHPHGPCFLPQGDGRFKVHLDHTPEDVDHVIVSVETILQEALGGRRQ
ncbi:MAG: hypothetical protein ACUVXH_11460 [Anaerolineae bacterium]